jgi:hypothetical protein
MADLMPRIRERSLEAGAPHASELDRS